MFFQGQYGNDIFLYEKYYNWIGTGYFNSVKGLSEFAWNGSGTSNTQPVISASDPNNNFRISRWYLEDGSYLRLKNITLGYTIPATLTQKLKISRLRFYLTSENLFTWVNDEYTGLDPELAENHGSLELGTNRYVYPNARTFIFGLNITF